jgi:hypothetical protein
MDLRWLAIILVDDWGVPLPWDVSSDPLNGNGGFGRTLSFHKRLCRSSNNSIKPF